MGRQRTVASARWRRRKEDRPGEIIAAALDCFAERGFAATRLDEVARRAGVTRGTLYLYFPSKEELFKAMVRQMIVPNIAQAETLVGESREPASVQLARILERWAALAATPASAIPKLVLSEAGNFPDLARFYLEEVIHRGTGVIRRLLRIGIERGEFRPVDVDHAVSCVVAPMIMSMLWRHSFARFEHRALDTAALCRAHFDLLSRGLAPGNGDAGPAAPPRRTRGAPR